MSVYDDPNPEEYSIETLNCLFYAPERVRVKKSRDKDKLIEIAILGSGIILFCASAGTVLYVGAKVATAVWHFFAG